MTRPKALKKQKKQGVDFKKIRRKIGRKLPPPKNATSTEIKSKAILLPEQSVASEKAGLAVNKKGLTLKELLQQTSHHNPKVRRDALMGIKDLFLKHPNELKLHKYAAIEKLRERIGDDDKVVRVSLHQLLKCVILPVFKEDEQRFVFSLLVGHIFKAMTYLEIDLRLMAFKFLDLVLEFHPPSFSSYADKILQSYVGILQTNQLYSQDKGKLKNALSALVHCLSLFPWNNGEIDSKKRSGGEAKILHTYEPDAPTESTGLSHIFEILKDLLPVLLDCFQEFMQLAHTSAAPDWKSLDCMLFIVQSIEPTVRTFIHVNVKGKSKQLNSYRGSDKTMWDEATSLLLMKKLLALFPLNPAHPEKDNDVCFMLNSGIAKIAFQFSERIWTLPDLLDKFLQFMENAMLGKVCRATRSGKAVWQKHLVSLLPFIPKIVSQVPSYWRSCLLEAFTKMFKESDPESSLKLACLPVIEDMLVPKEDLSYADSSDQETLCHQIAWIRELPLLLIQLSDKHPASSQDVLRLQLHLGQCALLNPLIVSEYDNMQYSLQEFYCKSQDEGNSPFIRLPRVTQELALCCLYYFTYLDLPLLKSIASCCMSPDLDPDMLFRIVEVLHSVYGNNSVNYNEESCGCIKIADYLSFFITLLSCFTVSPGNTNHLMEGDSYHRTFKSLTSIVCSYVAQMGDRHLIFQMIEKPIMDQFLLKRPLDNSCALLRMLVTVDSKPTRLSEQSIASLSQFLSEYLIDAVLNIPEENDESTLAFCLCKRRYYLLPCLFLFDRCHNLLGLVLDTMASSISQSRIDAIASVLQLLGEDAKGQHIMSLLKTDINWILRKIHTLLSSEENAMRVEERHMIQCSYSHLETLTRTLI